MLVVFDILVRTFDEVARRRDGRRCSPHGPALFENFEVLVNNHVDLVDLDGTRTHVALTCGRVINTLRPENKLLQPPCRNRIQQLVSWSTLHTSTATPQSS